MSSDSITFDHAVGFYDQTRGFPPGEEQAVAKLFVEAGGLDRDSRVLEVGVGTGRIALPLASHVAQYVGIDLSRPMMERLRAKQTGEPVAVLQGDITHLPLRDRAFQAVIAVHVFHLVPGWRLALAEVGRVLAPGGLLLVGRNDSDRQPEEELLWDAWHSEIPRERTTAVGVPRERSDLFPLDEGWMQVGKPLVHSFLTTRTLRAFFDRMEKRIWSSSWRLTDDEITRGLAAVRAAAKANNLDLDAPFEHEQRFSVRAYQPPGHRAEPTD